MLDYWFILVGALTDGLFYTLSGGEECRLWRALPQYEARPAGDEGASRVHPWEVSLCLSTWEVVPAMGGGKMAKQV